jgi:hypothetical protein
MRTSLQGNSEAYASSSDVRSASNDPARGKTDAPLASSDLAGRNTAHAVDPGSSCCVMEHRFGKTEASFGKKDVSCCETERCSFGMERSSSDPEHSCFDPERCWSDPERSCFGSTLPVFRPGSRSSRNVGTSQSFQRFSIEPALPWSSGANALLPIAVQAFDVAGAEKRHAAL